MLLFERAVAITVFEVTQIRTYSRKTNDLRNIYIIGRGARDIFIKNGKLTISKLKSFRLSQTLDETIQFVMDKSKSKLKRGLGLMDGWLDGWIGGRTDGLMDG